MDDAMLLAREAATLEQARMLATRPNVAPLELAEALWQAEQRMPGSMKAVVAQTGLSLRKAYYLLSIWERFAALNVSQVLLAEVGWTKLAMIARICAKGDEMEALELARHTTTRELPRILQGGRRDRPRRHSVLLRLSPTQYEVFAQALTKFGATTAKKGKGLIGKERALIKALGAIPLERRKKQG
jgi:hypothetical protein